MSETGLDHTLVRHAQSWVAIINMSQSLIGKPLWGKKAAVAMLFNITQLSLIYSPRFKIYSCKASYKGMNKNTCFICCPVGLIWNVWNKKCIKWVKKQHWQRKGLFAVIAYTEYVLCLWDWILPHCFPPMPRKGHSLRSLGLLKRCYFHLNSAWQPSVSLTQPNLKCHCGEATTITKSKHVHWQLDDLSHHYCIPNF